MLNLFLSFVLLFGVKSNIVVFNGAGALEFQKEKQHLKFQVLNSLFLAIGIVVCSLISYLLNSYVYKVYDLEYIGIMMSVLIVGIYNLFTSKIFSKMSHYMQYVYEQSHSFAIDFVFILSVIFMIDMSFAITEFIVMMAAIALVVFVTNFIVGIFVEDFNKSAIDKHYLNVPSRLFMLAIFSIILYYASQLIK